MQPGRAESGQGQRNPEPAVAPNGPWDRISQQLQGWPPCGVRMSRIPDVGRGEAGRTIQLFARDGFPVYGCDFDPTRLFRCLGEMGRLADQLIGLEVGECFVKIPYRTCQSTDPAPPDGPCPDSPKLGVTLLTVLRPGNARVDLIQDPGLDVIRRPREKDAVRIRLQARRPDPTPLRPARPRPVRPQSQP